MRVRFARLRSSPAAPSDLSRAALEGQVAELRGEVAELKRLVAALRDENARLKGLKGRPVIKPSSMEDATESKRQGKRGERRGRGKVVPRVAIEDRQAEALQTRRHAVRQDQHQPRSLRQLCLRKGTCCPIRPCNAIYGARAAVCH